MAVPSTHAHSSPERKQDKCGKATPNSNTRDALHITAISTTRLRQAYCQSSRLSCRLFVNKARNHSETLVDSAAVTLPKSPPRFRGPANCLTACRNRRRRRQWGGGHRNLSSRCGCERLDAWILYLGDPSRALFASIAARQSCP